MVAHTSSPHYQKIIHTEFLLFVLPTGYYPPANVQNTYYLLVFIAKKILQKAPKKVQKKKILKRLRLPNTQSIE